MHVMNLDNNALVFLSNIQYSTNKKFFWFVFWLSNKQSVDL